MYALVTAVMARRLLASPGTAIASDPGDPVLNAAILAWNAMRVPWTDAWYQFPIFYPTPDALTLSEHLLGVSLIASPIYWVTGNAVTAYNASLVVSYPLCGAATYALAWHLTRSRGAAFLAGLAFAFAPYRASQLPHIQVLVVFWAPLALLALHRFADVAAAPSAGPALQEPDPLSRRLRRGAKAAPWSRLIARERLGWLAAFGLCWLLQGASNGYFLVFFSVVVGLWILWFLVGQGRTRDAALVVGTIAVAALPLAPILYRYLTTQRALGVSRNLGEIASFSADIAAPLCASPSLTFWGRLRVACAQEGELFPGVALLTLSALALLVHSSRSRTADSVGSAGARLTRRAPLPRDRARAMRPLSRAAVGAAIVFGAIALSTVVLGPWRIDAGFLRASASSFDKPLSVALLLLLVAWLLSARFSRMVQRGSMITFYALAAVVCWVMSWGPFPRLFGVDVLYQAPYAWLLQVPGVGGLRVPARFWMMTVLCLVVVMALAVAPLLGRLRARARLAAVVLAAFALLIDGWVTIPAAPVPARAARPAPGSVVLSLPVGDVQRDIAAVYDAVTGGWRIVNGYSGHEPGYYEALRTLSAANEQVLFDPFVSRTDLEVITPERHYRLPRRAAAARRMSAPGRRLTPAVTEATCGAGETRFATDGSYDTQWVCGPQTADRALTVDLGNVQEVGAVVHALGSRGAEFPRHLLIETSADGSVWQPAWEGSPAAAVLFAAMEAPRETRVLLTFTSRPARYVRLRQTGRHEVNYWSIAELEVWSGS